MTAANIANANQSTNTQAINIAIGSIHFTKMVIELSTSLVYCAWIFSQTLFTVDVFSHAHIICMKSLGKYTCSGSVSSILCVSFFHEDTFSAIISIASL